MERLVISTKKSLYKPIEVVIDGVSYKIEKVSPELLEKVTKYDKDADEGKTSALVKQLELLIGIKKEVAMEMDIRDISRLTKFILGKILKPEKAEGEKDEEEIKELKPREEE